jgi:hypothetical protein
VQTDNRDDKWNGGVSPRAPLIAFRRHRQPALCLLGERRRVLKDVSTKKKRSYIVSLYLRRKIKSREKNHASIENLRHGQTIVPTQNHYCDGALMVAVVGIMMEQFVKMRGGGERDDNQELTDE